MDDPSLFSVGVAVAGVGVFVGLAVWDKARTRRRERETLALPGRSSATALEVASYREVDARAARELCRCGKFFRQTGEGTRAVEGRRLRVIRLACTHCRATAELFFAVATA